MVPSGTGVPSLRGADGAGGLGVDVGEALKIALGVAGRHAGHPGGLGARAGAAPCDQALWLAEAG